MLWSGPGQFLPTSHNKYCSALCVGLISILLVASWIDFDVCQNVLFSHNKYTKKRGRLSFAWSFPGQDMNYVTLPEHMTIQRFTIFLSDMSRTSLYPVYQLSVEKRF